MKIKALVLMGLTLYPTTGDYFMPDAVEYVATPTKKARYTNDVSGLTQYINTIAPKVPTKRARALAKIILDAARRRKVDPFIYAALIRHESAFAPGAMNCYKRKDGYMCDYGLPQINEVWLAELGLDANRLIEDEAYAIDTGARILARAKFQYGSDPKWYLYYHSGIERHRKKYEESVGPYIDAQYDNVIVYVRTTKRPS